MSGQIVHLESDPHVAVLKLLPWYLTGRLDAAESAQVDEHLAVCDACRAELDTERHWQLMQPGHGAQVDVEEGWANMRAMLGGEANAPWPKPPVADGGADGAGAFRRGRRGMPKAWQLGGRPLSRAWAAPAMLSIALVVAIGITLRPAPAPFGAPVGASVGDFHALAAPAEDSATAVVRFRPDATEAQIRGCLNDSGARLVDGPTVTDAYVVRLPRDRYAAALDKLRRQQAVALVEALESAAPR
jgi:hypothetical protein